MELPLFQAYGRSMAAVKTTTTTNNEEREHEKVFNPKWFSDNDFGFKIQGFSTADINFKSDRLQTIKQSLLDIGYNKTFPIILAKSADPAANGVVLDGRNRLIACDFYYAVKETLPAIKFIFEGVKDVDHAELRQMMYEAHHLTEKGADEAKGHILQIYERLRHKHPDWFAQKTMDDVLPKEAKVERSESTMFAFLKTTITVYQKKEDMKARAKMQPATSMMKESAFENWGEKKEPVGAVVTAGFQKVIKEFSGELETQCEGCGKKQNHAINGKLFDDGSVKVELVT